MPCKPTLFGPRLGVTLMVLPPLLDLSPVGWPLLGALPVIDPSLLVLVGPQVAPSLCCGDCDRTGLFVTLKPGDTARRLMEWTSKSSSLRRFFLRPSAAVGGTIACGVDPRDMESSLMGSDVDILCRYCVMEATGRSMFRSSLIADELPRAR